MAFENAKRLILRYGTRNLERAKKAAQETAKAAREAIRNVKDVAKRRELREGLKDEQKAARAGLRELKAENRLRARGRRVLGREVGGVGERLRQPGAQALEAVGIAKGLAGGSPVGALGSAVAKLSGPAALIFQAAQAAYEFIRPEIDRLLAIQRLELDARIDGAVERKVLELEIGERFRRDPTFRRAQAERFGAELRGINRAIGSFGGSARTHGYYRTLEGF